MRRTIRLFIAVAASLAAVPSIAMADPAVSANPSISGHPVVGQTLVCNPGTWSDDTSTITGYQYAWFYAGDQTQTTLPSGSDSTYQVQPADLGHAFMCAVTATDAASASSTADSAQSWNVRPLARVDLTQWSRQVSGNVGAPESGITVEVELVRADSIAPQAHQTASDTTTTTDANGDWSLTMDQGVGDPGDRVEVNYYDGSGVDPFPAVYTFAPAQLAFPNNSASISSDGTTITNQNANLDCSQLVFAVDGAAQPAGCTATPSAPVTDANRVTESYSQTGVYVMPGTGPNLPTVSTVDLHDSLGLPGVASGTPACSANLAVGLVTCDNLDQPGGYTLTVTGAPQISGVSTITTDPATVDLSTEPASSGPYSVQTDVGPIGDGETLTLRENGVSRALTTLTAHTLQASFDANQTPSQVVCAPYRELLTASDQAVPCHGGNGSTGSLAADEQAVTELDDTSGGQVYLDPPVLQGLTPSGSTPVDGSSGVAAQAILVSEADPSQTAAAFSSGDVFASPTGSQTTNGDAALTAGLDQNGDAYVSGTTNPLDAGGYDATWAYSDFNGDTITYTSSFTVQAGSSQGGGGSTGGSGTGGGGSTGGTGSPSDPGSTGSSASAGAGATGTQGSPAGGAPAVSGSSAPSVPNGSASGNPPVNPGGAPSPVPVRSGSVLCTVSRRTVGRHAVLRPACTVSVPTAGSRLVTVRLSRGRRTYATGTALVHQGAVRLRLRTLRALSGGRFLVTVVIRFGTRVTVSHRWLYVRR